MTNEIQVTTAEQYQKAALNTLKRQITMGVNIPKNFDAEGALGYTALAIVNSGFTVSKEVIVDTLIKVASKGLDPRKDQLYVIPNKKGQVMLMESYFGYEKLAYDIPEIERGSIFAEVVRQGETVSFKGRTLEHEKSFEAIDNDIIGAYAKVKIGDEEIAHYMSVYQISKSWSKTNSLDKNFIEEQRHNNYGNSWTVKVADTSKIEKGNLTAFNKNQEDFPEEMYENTRCFHTSGITLGLGGPVRENAIEMMKKFKEKGALISFDVNFRGNLWTGDEARDCITEILPIVDIFFSSEFHSQSYIWKNRGHKRNPEKFFR